MTTQDAHPALHAASRTATVIVVCVVFAAISSGLLLLRLYLRCRVLKAAGLDDGTVLIAQVGKGIMEINLKGDEADRQMLAIAVSVSTILGMSSTVDFR